MIEIYLFFICISGLLLLILLVYKVATKPKNQSHSILSDLTVIIPFRNEIENLPGLIESLRTQTELPKRIIFVNDHSTDESALYVQNYLSESNIALLLELPENLTGKKHALRFGFQEIKSEYCLTLDADTWFDEHFFENINIQKEEDLQIRPVVMNAYTFLGFLASTEHLFFNSLNYILSPIYILSASGANLLIKTSSIPDKDDMKSHEHIASGDDHYLLRRFQSKRAKISVTNNRSAIVSTRSTDKISDYLNQRIRWLGKTKLKTTFAELFIGFLIVIYLIGGFISILYLIFQAEFKLLLILFSLRTVIDAIFFLSYAIPLRKAKQLWVIPFLQLLYPMLFITVLFGAMFYRPVWKGRKMV